jgi:succinate dehydrogenase / fumarate reductase cytochrome b subunit
MPRGPRTHRFVAMAAEAKTMEEPPLLPSRLGALWRSWIGKKALMAVTGFGLFAFVLVHMIANLLAFRGGPDLDGYAAQLRAFPALLWTARGLLAVAALVHVVAGAQLWAARRRARGVAYREHRPGNSSASSRTMFWSGFLVLGFVVYHLLDLTFGVVNPDFRDGEVFHNLVTSLARGAAAGFYVIAVAGLGFHLWHGLWSAFQSLGIANRAFTPELRRLAAAFATLLAVGFAAVPLAILFGVVR